MALSVHHYYGNYKADYDYSPVQISRKRDRVTGLSTVVYKLESTVELSIDGTPVHFVNVKLDCDYEKTPFCDNTT